MYDGFFEIFVGFFGIVLSFFRKNRTDLDASFIKRHNKQLLLWLGILMVIIGTIDFLVK